MEATKTKEMIHQTKSWFFEKINKIDKTWASLMKKKREGSNKSEVTVDTTEVQRIIKDYCEQLYSRKYDDNIKEIDKFLEKNTIFQEWIRKKYKIGTDQLLVMKLNQLPPNSQKTEAQDQTAPR